MFFKDLTNNSCSFWKSHCLCALGSVWNWGAYLCDVLESHFHLVVMDQLPDQVVLNTMNYLAWPPVIIPEWTIFPLISASYTPFVTGGDTSSRICLSWGQAPVWGQFNQAKPDVHNVTGWIPLWSPSLTGLFFFPFDNQDTLDRVGCWFTL